jgi:hypothetical protein|uniref:Uncharacterized protein n=2 Tax=Mus TaxID=862507 RepID=Q9CRS9_MOUSE|nr:unnamed protein product [Mus musculus]BAC28079.1 unnamed protein product [Mus musculus]
MGSELNSTPQLSLGFTILPPKIKFFGDLDNQKLYKLQGTVELSPFLLDLFLSLPSLTVLELLLGWAPNILPRSFFSIHSYRWMVPSLFSMDKNHFGLTSRPVLQTGEPSWNSLPKSGAVISPSPFLPYKLLS